MFTSDCLLRFMFLAGEPHCLLSVRGVLLHLTVHLALLGLPQVRTGDPPVTIRSQDLPPPLLSAPATGGAAGAPVSPVTNLAVVH